MTPGLLVVVFIAVMFLIPGPARAQGEDALAYAEQAIAPAVVRQGEFALHLAEALAIEVAEDDEDGAIRALAALGVEPAGGWQPDQAMTPQVVAELRADVADAAAAGRLGMETEAALKAFRELLTELGLPLPVEPTLGYGGAGPPLNGYGPYCDATATHYFYGSYGLPLYSYCYPPAAYIHHYYWVPGAFRAHGHAFAGFFMLRQVHLIQHVQHHRHFGHRFDGGKPRHVHKPERRVIRVIQPPEAVHRKPAHAEHRDTQSGISRTQSGVMQHKSEIMQRLPPAVPSRIEPARPGAGRAVRFGGHVSATHPRHVPTAQTQRVSGIQHEKAPRRMVAPPAAAAASVARPAPGVAANPPRHHPHRTAASWNKHSANAVADPRVPARDLAPSRARLGMR